jgi:hypothetical protein
MTSEFGASIALARASKNRGTMADSDVPVDNNRDSEIDIRKLLHLALTGLRQMYHQDTKMFCYRTELKGGVLVKKGISRTNTLITLIGIRKAELAGYQSPVDTGPILNMLRDAVTNFNSVGDMGLYLWLISMYGPEKFESHNFRIDLASALRRYPDAKQNRTMELSWLLSGLSEAAIACPAMRAYSEVAANTFRLINANQESSGLFRHSSKAGSLSGRVRSRIASFADQIYPIYAFARFCEAYAVARAGAQAVHCAKTICELQGPLGQWWWHYDVVEGTVIGQYPVYSVHQDGMAPMGLLALSRVSGIDFAPAVYKGLNWIFGQNELKLDLRETKLSVVWRNIHTPAHKRYLAETASFFFGRRPPFVENGLRVLYECHPYHLGWLLFALADSC